MRQGLQAAARLQYPIRADGYVFAQHVAMAAEAASYS